MSRRTIRATDLMVAIMNWNSSLANAYPEEAKRWTKLRDRKMAALRKTMSEFTPNDISHLERRSPRTLEQLKKITRDDTKDR